LILEGNELLPYGTEIITKGLKSNKYLYELNLSSNLLGDEGCICIAHSLVENTSLRNLNISSNEIGIVGIEKLCFILLDCNIKILNLSKNYLNDDSAILLSNVISDKKCHLEKLNISDCRISDVGAK